MTWFLTRNSWCNTLRSFKDWRSWRRFNRLPAELRYSSAEQLSFGGVPKETPSIGVKSMVNEAFEPRLSSRPFAFIRIGCGDDCWLLCELLNGSKAGCWTVRLSPIYKCNTYSNPPSAPGAYNMLHLYGPVGVRFTVWYSIHTVYSTYVYALYIYMYCMYKYVLHSPIRFMADAETKKCYPALAENSSHF